MDNNKHNRKRSGNIFKTEILTKYSQILNQPTSKEALRANFWYKDHSNKHSDPP